MGYLISAHVALSRPDVTKLSELPQSIGYRLHYHRSANVFILDTFRRERPAKYPFQTALPAADVDLELPPSLHDLEAIYRYLDQRKLANSFKKSYINFGRLLSRLWGQSVLSILCDDDEWDFACENADGELRNLACRCADLRIVFESGKSSIQVVQSEEDDDEPFTDHNDLRKALPQIDIVKSAIGSGEELHEIALRSWARFSDGRAPILGLGSFDPPDDSDELDVIASSPPQ